MPIWALVLIIIFGSIFGIFLLLCLVALIKKPSSIYKNKPEERNPMEGKMVELKNKRLGKFYVIKENKYFDYVLIFAPDSEQFVLAYGLDKEYESWLDGHYYGMNIELALKEYLILYREIMKSGDVR